MCSSDLLGTGLSFHNFLYVKRNIILDPMILSIHDIVPNVTNKMLCPKDNKPTERWIIIVLPSSSVILTSTVCSSVYD